MRADGVDTPAQGALLELAALDKTDFDRALKRILAVDAHTLAVERVNFWWVQREPPAIVCERHYSMSSDCFQSGNVLRGVDFPRYFAALWCECVIAADNAQTDPRTSEFTAGYLVPLGITSMMDVPIWLQGELVGVLCHEHVGPPRHWTTGEKDFVLGGAQLVANALELRGRCRAEAAERAARFLSEATMLLTESFDVEQIPARLAQLAIPFLGDWCLIDVFEAGQKRLLAAAHLDPAMEPLLGALTRITPAAVSLDAQLRAGQPLLFPDVQDDQRLMSSLDASQLQALAALGTRTMMVVPFVAHGRALGVIAFGSAAPDRRFGPNDLALAQELARRAAIGIENAQLYRKSQEAVRVRDEFLSIASHELHTPLTSLQLAVQGLQSGLLRGSEATRARAAAIAVRQVQRLSALIEELLDSARVEAGRLGLRLEQVDLAAVIRDVVDQFRDPYDREATPLAVRADANVMGRWDRLRLEQVITNLLSNALKFGAGAPVEISAEVVDGMARLVVVDHGIGIPPDSQPHVFERFERAVSSRRYGGLGLGLYIVHGIVTALGGTVRVTSELGAGATFTVDLPTSGPLNS